MLRNYIHLFVTARWLRPVLHIESSQFSRVAASEERGRNSAGRSLKQDRPHYGHCPIICLFVCA